MMASIGNWAYVLTSKLAVARARGGDDPLKLAHTVRHLGDAYYYAGRAALAEPCYVEALSIYRSHEDTAPLDFANAIRSFAVLKHEVGAAEQAQHLWQEAHDLYVKVNVPAGVAESAARLALLTRRQGDLQRSREYMIEASAAADAADDPETLQYIRSVAAQLENSRATGGGAASDRDAGAMDLQERAILEALQQAVRSATSAIDSIVISVDQRLRDHPGNVLAWQAIPLDVYATHLPEAIRSSWAFVLRANVATGAERHPNSHQRMMSYRGRGDFQTRLAGKWCSHHLRSDPAAPLEQRWISIPPSVWHQGVVGSENWAVVSFHTVPEHELIEERPAVEIGELTRQRKYADGT